MKVSNPQALVSVAFRHELIKKVAISIRIAWKTFGETFLEKSPEGFYPEAVNPVQPRAGYQAVPESRTSLSVRPT